MAICVYPRVRLAHAPTPMEFLANLTQKLGGPDIYVKRDDCTGLALGGNKARQLEYYLGEARARNADTLLITGAVQSNFVRQAAAAARRLAMQIHIQLEDRVPGMDTLYHTSGNVLLDQLLGATLHNFPSGESEAAADANLDRIADELRAKGNKPYVVHLGVDHPPLGALGYVDAAEEILGQIEAQDLSFDALVVASGSAATHSGLLAGLRGAGSGLPVYGICVRRNSGEQAQRVHQRASEVSSMIGSANRISNEDVILYDDWLAPGYGLPGEEVKEAILMTCRSEGLLLDPVYTGKCMAGLMGLIRRGDFSRGQKVLFIHTGGAPVLFGYPDLLPRDASSGVPQFDGQSVSGEAAPKQEVSA